MDLDSNFFEQAGGIQKLFGLGWSSIVATDDVNKRATFCMKPFNGMCSSIPYSYLYASLGHSKVYNDLEDVRRSAGPIFRMKGKYNKLLDCHLLKQERNEIMLTENLESFKNKFNEKFITKFYGSMKAAIKTQDPMKAKDIISQVPEPTTDMLSKIGIKVSPDFTRTKMVIQKVLENSTSIPSDISERLALGITFAAAIKGKGKDIPNEAKDLLKSFVSQYRLKKLSPDDRKDIIIMSVAFLISSIPIVMLISALTYVVGAYTMGPIGLVLACVSILLLAVKVKKKD